MFKLHGQSMLSAAQNWVSSLRWRFAVGALFAAGVGFVFDSFSAGFGWYLALCLSMSFDAMLGKSYLDARGERGRGTSGVLFIWGSTFSVLIFAAMTIVLAASGGESGRVLGVLMAASSVVSVMLFLFRARAFMAVMAAPSALCLLAMPFIPSQDLTHSPTTAALGVACGVAGFFAYVGRAALNNARMFNSMQAAASQARQRQSEAEAKQAEAESSNRAKSEFLTIMTHELRTPLNAVIGYSEIISEDMEAQGSVSTQADAERIAASARHLLGLIDQVLQMSTLDTNRVQLALSDVFVGGVIEQSVAAIADQAAAGGNRISVRVAPNLNMAHTDGDKLAACLGHLLSNAAKFTSNGLIAVTAEREKDDAGEWMRIAVSDTGVGIAGQDLAHAFLPFTQLDSATTRTRGGMGLGLPIAARTAKLLGGDVSAVSERGVGSTFTLRLPLRLAPKAARPATTPIGAAA